MLLLAQDGVKPELAQELDHVRRIIAHDEGDHPAVIELVLRGVPPKLGHHTLPSHACGRTVTGAGAGPQAKTMVLLPSSSTRSSQCQDTARASTTRSM